MLISVLVYLKNYPASNLIYKNAVILLEALFYLILLLIYVFITVNIRFRYYLAVVLYIKNAVIILLFYYNLITL